MAKGKSGVSPRSQARRYAVLALYQWGVTKESPVSIKRHMLDDPEWLDALAASLSGADDDAPVDPKERLRFDHGLLDELMSGVPAHVTQIDASLDAVLDRPISQVDPVELAILRLGAYEIMFAASVPHQVAINEAVELAKLLGAHAGHRYVNGVLDQVARRSGAVNASPRT
jgi:N utilization substance protein B